MISGEVEAAVALGEVRGEPRPQPECAISGCGYKAVSRGWCIGHYNRWRRTGDPSGLIRRQTWRETVGPVLDALVIDGGWLTSEGVALLLPHLDQSSVDTALTRLRREGAIRSRRIELTTGWGEPMMRRWEWKAV